ncbi:molybdenum cofactor guanylyltransferase [Sphingomonas hengshuiensis]|uniref:MobA-like NTP transferase domain-containing protein n=1 Tax=Sphingomonas hengshuiensis TaxID=1609977 RepID=A0A7U5BFJ7_9SPHN|nr:molybdenum cofactor guanylyltransferase [Sphingomonas hengshuiensis]AJP74351.1 hypothetical protein TS85_07640 [Sphingomonas hengshuiensis]
MRILGAVLAGGQSRRFGSDKAMARIGDMLLIDHVLQALAPQVDALVLCGRSWGGVDALVDRPAPGLGPLGGLNAALHHAAERGFAGVLSVPVDVFPLPPDLRERLVGETPRTLLRQHALGYWPVALAPLLDAQLAAGARSIRAWIDASGASAHDDAALGLRNINTPGDLPHDGSLGG